MKYGAITFKETSNLGDDIQTYAASQFYPHIDYFIERERIDSFYSFDGEKVAAIMAGWYTHSPLNWPPSEFIYPYMVSMHFTENMRCQFGTQQLNVLDDECCKNWFLEGYSGSERKNEEGGVGCRDMHTLKMLESIGVKTWFSGCITLTLERFTDVSENGKILCIDVEEEIVDVIRRHTKKEVISMTHSYQSLVDVESRMELVEKRLKIYQGASLIITKRLHAALPSIALGTPVVYIVSDKTDYRFEDYLNGMNCLREEDILHENYEYDFDNPLDNPTYLLETGKILSEKCKEFVKHCEAMDNIPTVNMQSFLNSVNRIERLKKYIYLENKDFYLQGYSTKEKDPYIDFQNGMNAYSFGEYDKARALFYEAFKKTSLDNKLNQLNVLSMYVRCLLKEGFIKEAAECYSKMENSYRDFEEYKKLEIEIEDSIRGVI